MSGRDQQDDVTVLAGRWESVFPGGEVVETDLEGNSEL